MCAHIVTITNVNQMCSQYLSKIYVTGIFAIQWLKRWRPVMNEKLIGTTNEFRIDSFRYYSSLKCLYADYTKFIKYWAPTPLPSWQSSSFVKLIVFEILAIALILSQRQLPRLRFSTVLNYMPQPFYFLYFWPLRTKFCKMAFFLLIWLD